MGTSSSTSSQILTNIRPLTHNGHGWCNHAAYLKDGPSVIDKKMLLRFVTQVLYCFNLYMGEQLPEEYGLRIDMDEFLNAFSAVDEDGIRRRVGSWPSGPGFRKASLAASLISSDSQTLGLPTTEDNAIIGEEMVEEMVNQASYRKSLKDLWLKYLSHAGGHIPYAICKLNGLPALDGDNAGVERTSISNNGRGGRPSGTFKQFQFYLQL